MQVAGVKRGYKWHFGPAYATIYRSRQPNCDIPETLVRNPRHGDRDFFTSSPNFSATTFKFLDELGRGEIRVIRPQEDLGLDIDDRKMLGEPMIERPDGRPGMLQLALYRSGGGVTAETVDISRGHDRHTDCRSEGARRGRTSVTGFRGGDGRKTSDMDQKRGHRAGQDCERAVQIAHRRYSRPELWLIGRESIYIPTPRIEEREAEKLTIVTPESTRR